MGEKCSPTLPDKHLWCQGGKHTVYPTLSKLKFAVFPYNGVQICSSFPWILFLGSTLPSLVVVRKQSLITLFILESYYLQVQSDATNQRKVFFTDVTQLPLLHHPPTCVSPHSTTHAQRSPQPNLGQPAHPAGPSPWAARAQGFPRVSGWGLDNPSLVGTVIAEGHLSALFPFRQWEKRATGETQTPPGNPDATST